MDSNDLIVSIRCLVYNHEPYLRQCLDGFVMQKTNFKFEAVVHDDASTDESAAIIREYAEKYPDIIKPIFETENQYSKHDGSLGRIMKEACIGKYVAMCEGDDYWVDPLKLQKQVDILEADETLMAVVTNTKMVDKEGNELNAKQDNVVPNNKQGRYDLRNFINNVHHYPTATVCYRRSHVDEVEEMTRHTANPYLGDWTLWICLHIFGDFYYLDEVTSAYRINPASVTHTCDRIGRAKANWTICKAVQDILPNEYDDIRRSLDNIYWAWIDLAFAYKHEHQYFRMFWCFFVAFIKDPKGWINNMNNRRKKAMKNK